MERIGITASRSYDVLIGEKLLPRLGELAAPLVRGKKCAVVADDITASLFGKTACSSLEAAGFEVFEYIIPVGEDSKSAESYISLLEFLAEKNITRADFIVALGGGVVGDLTGFTAASYLRGVPFIQIPTTLLAAVDSSVGGKTAINLRAGKNLAGAFYQPTLVICDTDIIKNLPDAVFSDGMAEVIKYGALGSAEVLDLCADGARKNLNELITKCICMKRDIVSEDEFDTSLRQLLNLGHTPAHAIEKLSSFSISHGRAVAIGMCLMARAAESAGECESGVAEELIRLCKLYNLPTECDYSSADMSKYAMSDKKRSSGEITLVLPKKRGLSVLKKVPVGEVSEIFAKGKVGEKWK